MQIEIKIDKTCKEPKIILLTDKMTDQINGIVQKLSEDVPKIITGFRDDMLHIIKNDDLFRIYAANSKVFAVTRDEEYTLRMRLYELEDRLDKNSFVRISNSEIVNLKKVEKFDLSFLGTICVILSDGSRSYVSRRYVNKIKQVLGI